MKPRRVQFAVILVLVAAAVSGCDSSSLSGGPFSLMRAGDGLLLAVCAPTAASGAYVEERDATTGDWTTVYESNGSSTVALGDTFSTADGLPGLATTISEAVPFDYLKAVAVTVLAEVGSKGNIGAVWDVRGSDIPRDEWLHGDGTVGPEKCGQP